MKLAAAAAGLKRANGGISAPFSLAFLTDRRRIANPEPILRALPAGAAVIYRDYDDPRRESLARRYQAICRRRGTYFLVGADVGLAVRIAADGAHMPSWMLRNVNFPAGLERETARMRGNEQGVARIRPVSGPDSIRIPPIITAACHDADDLRRAALAGADLAFVSPVFATQSHPDSDYLGPDRFKLLAAAAVLPVLALGGVDQSTAPLLAGSNVAGFGAIGAFAA